MDLPAALWSDAAALDQPDGSVREVLFPLVSEATLAALVKESQAAGPTFRQRIQTLIHRSYGHHYRRMLPPILDTLAFRSNNSAQRPVIAARDWLRAHRDDRRQWLPCSEVTIAGVVRPQLHAILVETGPDRERINRIDYEICVLQVLRERLRCKEVWVEGAERYRNPDDDLLDVLKETDLRVGFTEAFKTLASREVVSREVLQQRLLLCLYGLGTNTGLKRMAASNREVEYPDLLYVRRRFIEKAALREAIRRGHQRHAGRTPGAHLG